MIRSFERARARIAASLLAKISRRRRGRTDPDGWGDLSAEDLRRRGIRPGMTPPDSEQGPRAVHYPDRGKHPRPGN